MRAVMYGAGEVRIEDVSDAHLIEPTDALVAVTRAAICGSDLNLTIGGGPAVRAYIEDLPDVLEGRIEL